MRSPSRGLGDVYKRQEIRRQVLWPAVLLGPPGGGGHGAGGGGGGAGNERTKLSNQARKVFREAQGIVRGQGSAQDRLQAVRVSLCACLLRVCVYMYVSVTPVRLCTCVFASIFV